MVLPHSPNTPCLRPPPQGASVQSHRPQAERVNLTANQDTFAVHPRVGTEVIRSGIAIRPRAWTLQAFPACFRVSENQERAV